jgi:hypothetical protein
VSERAYDIDEMSGLDPAAWSAYLARRSGLPGPRANLALVLAAARTAGPDAIRSLLDDGGEYQVMCAAAAAARRAGDPSFEAEARALAADQRWRVREGVAMGLQLWGDDDPAAMIEKVRAWADDPDPLVVRAALAAICEPRLLRTPDAAAVALEMCDRATDRIASLPAAERRRPEVRTLRQALGYCWSVAVAADPPPGVEAFTRIDTGDPDLAWIANENRKKKRLSSLL